ncbi:metallo-beta-lactamase domain protein [Cadophora sp. MPI-SDFR-AT-0126]|nr:metallo-beta-lactamase domain protein [Leotiomycetes sp. MPI-SDFR-AT-0126]
MDSKSCVSEQQSNFKVPYTSHGSSKASILPTSSQGPQRQLRNGLRTTAFPEGQQNLARREPYSTVVSKTAEAIIHNIFEKTTGTWQYLIADPSTLSAVIIDPVLDYDPVTQVISTRTADALLATAIGKGYKVDKILETHAHADHLTAAFYLQKQVTRLQGHRPPTCIGKRIKQVQRMLGEKYGVVAEEYDGVFDIFLDDDETFSLGDVEVIAMHLPGHTPDHLGYKIGDNVFCGDSIFHADIGSARCDFPGGSAHDLFRSGRRLLALPSTVKIWTGHDYPPNDRTTPMAFMTVQDHRKQNKHLSDSVTEEDFVHLRKERDATLGEPRLLHQSLQINIRGGRPPKPTALGDSFLHLPMKLKGVEL